MGALDSLIRPIRSAMKMQRPFYSKLDEALENLKREKGTAEEFMREIEKQPGVKKAEIEDRGIRKALAARAQAPDANKSITKDRMRQIIQSNPPAPVEEAYKLGKEAEYSQYSTPGGKNYREILLKLPEDYLGQPYVGGHYEEPNILAHIRVKDFEGPGGKKVLLVDEIQSDWHQAGRKEGYKTGYEQGQISNLASEYDKLTAKRRQLLKQAEEMPDGGVEFAALVDEANSITPQLMRLQSQMDDLRTASQRGVPDAPFKKNWHELAMKRVLDYAAENGYDTVAITPGAEQAKRYDLSKNLESIQLVSPNKESLQDSIFNGYSKDGRVVNRLINTPKELSELVGKEVAEKLIQQQFVKGKEGNAGSFIRRLENQDLTIGGEGMKGFYDKILPDYLNTFGKQYGSGVGEIDLITKPEKSVPQIAAPGLGHFPEPIIEPAQTMKAWSFDITPQLREQIKTKGLPLYSKTGMGPEGLAAGTGAATIGAEALTGEDEQQVQNPVHFTENPDAMQLELMQRN